MDKLEVKLTPAQHRVVEDRIIDVGDPDYAAGRIVITETTLAWDASVSAEVVDTIDNAIHIERDSLNPDDPGGIGRLSSAKGLLKKIRAAIDD